MSDFKERNEHFARAMTDAQVSYIEAERAACDLEAENAKLRDLLEAVLQCAGEIKRDKGCDACPMYNGPWRNDGIWCLLRPTLRELLGVEVD